MMSPVRVLGVLSESEFLASEEDGAVMNASTSVVHGLWLLALNSLYS